MVAMSWNAPNVVFDLVRRYQITCEARQSGTIRASHQRGYVGEIEASFRQGEKRGMPVELLDKTKMAELTGSDRYENGFIDRRGGHVNPLGYARGLAQAAQQAGATICGGTPAMRIWRDAGKWHVETPTGTVHADRLVLGTNGYTDDVWPDLKRTIVPVYSGIVASEPLPDDVAKDIFPIRSSLYEIGMVTVYYRLDANNRVLMGGRCRQSDATGPDQLGFLKEHTFRLWPQLRQLKFTHGWNGQLAVTRDYYPHIHEPAEGVLVCLGYNGRGVAMSSTMGQQLAHRTLGGKTAEIDMPITDLKGIPFHGLWKTAVAARITYGRIRDWLNT
jgi:glycine/D-amino acid oxidase-like deaminating enzyme